MNGLVGYASSDEEDDIVTTRPTKIVKTGDHSVATAAAANSIPQQPAPATVSETPHISPTNNGPSIQSPPGPSAGPLPKQPVPEADPSATPPASPYTAERTLLRNLTMPTHPNFNIPASPSPPPQNSEAALALSTTTKKIDRFLELKAQGVHFNARLDTSSSLRNPGLLPKLMDFAGISGEESHASTLRAEEGGAGVPVRWPEEWYAENLVKENERRERKARRARGEVEFVHAKGKERVRSAAGSKAGTPKGGSEHRKSSFDW